MQFNRPLIAGQLIRRYKRFLADVKLEGGEIVTAHCVNPGAMLGIARPDDRVWLMPVTNPKAKLKYRWMIEEVDGTLIGVDTTLPNRLAPQAVSNGEIVELKGYKSLRTEIRYGENSRIDMLLEGPGSCYVEVKNVHLKRREYAAFPDCVTKRGAKHLQELSHMVALGHRAVMLYIVQRQDCRRFTVARDLDPGYGRALDDARAQGVEVYAYDCHVGVNEIKLSQALEIAVDDVVDCDR